MTLREFMNVKRNEDSDRIIAVVMSKILDKLQEETSRGMINSYSPSNIYLSNFNVSNLNNLIVRFGAPITSRLTRNDGIYLAPEIHRGEPVSMKTIVFTMGVIWDEMIHQEAFFKNADEITNASGTILL